MRVKCIMNKFINFVLYNIVLANKSRRNIWSRYVALTAGKKIAYEISVAKTERKITPIKKIITPKY